MGHARRSGEKGFLALEQESTQPEYEEAFVEIAGVRLHYLHAGTGAPMFLIHGLVGSCADWHNNFDALAQKSSVYAIDLLNMGKSQRVEGSNASLRATATSILAVMDSLGLAEADIVAHSYGGAIALMVAALRPRRVSRLILFAPANPYSRSSDAILRIYSTKWGRFVARMLPYLPTPIQRIALGQMYGGAKHVADTCLQQIVECLRCPGTLRHVLAIIHSWFAEMSRLEAVLRRVARIPTLLVWGDRDSTVSLASGIQLHHKLRASELVVLPGGHSVFEESPEESNRIMLEWLDRHPLPALPASIVPGAIASRSSNRARPLTETGTAPAAPNLLRGA
jgi:pimeloyl-ACP methyl ester carboxylesterase